jgi:aryl-alcohol dehydrogenase-like predicted oxidoreductase
MLTRKIWDGQKIPALGMGCWAIGGPFFAGATALGWGRVDDAESKRAISAAVEYGVRLFDTAQAYGTGNSEFLLGEVLADHQDVLISTKVGYGIDPATQQLTGEMHDPDMIEASLNASLKRLKRDHIDIVFLHLNEASVATASEIFERLDKMRDAGRLRAFGWSTDYPERASAFHGRDGFVAVQHAMNVLFKAEKLLPVLEEHKLLSFNRSPLAMGLLSGKYASSSLMARDDVRGQNAEWIAYFKNGQVAPEYLAMFNTVRELLQSDGRTSVQGALAWLWARSDLTIPLPGFRTVTQVEDICGALTKGALRADVMAEIEHVIQRPPEGPPRAR